MTATNKKIKKMKLIKNIVLITSSILLSSFIISCSEDDSFNPVSIDTYTDEVVNFEEITPEFSETNELEATFEPYAANAVSYDVFFWRC